jgi:hypothetical protein
LLEQIHQLCKDDNLCRDLVDGGWRCLDENGISFTLEGLPAGFLKNRDLISAGTMLTISDAAKLPATSSKANIISANPGAIVSTKPVNGKWIRGRNLRHGEVQERGLAPNQGVSTVLVVHVTDSEGVSSSTDANGLRSDVFDDNLNLVSKRASCWFLLN